MTGSNGMIEHNGMMRSKGMMEGRGVGKMMENNGMKGSI